MENPESQSADTEIPWPSFVDILSAVIMMFIFLLLIVIIVLTTMTIKTQTDLEDNKESIVQEKVDETLVTMIQQSSESVKSQIREMLKESESESESEAVSSAMQEQQNDPSKENNPLGSEFESKKNSTQQIESLSTALAMGTGQKIKSDSELKEVTIFFNRNEITLSDEVIEKLLKIVSNESGGSGDILIETTINPKTISVLHAKEQALARTLNTRNTIMSSGIDSKKIKMKQIPPTEKEKSYDWLTIHLK